MNSKNSNLMTTEDFFSHFYEELLHHSALHHYYKFTTGTPAQQAFRKAYFIQRLDYIAQHIDFNNAPTIYDIGCGYGTTCLFFAMNGVKSHGSTLEFYINEIEKRKNYWQQFGDTTLFTYEYADLFDQKIAENSVDYIILQDTLHHIEPIDKALKIFYKMLKPTGKIILIEENGGCLIQRFKLFLQRGNKRIIEYYDERLQKQITMGNENIRTLQQWNRTLEAANFRILPENVQYIRYFLPFKYKNCAIETIITKEKARSSCHFLRQNCFFGINMVIEKR